MQTLVIDIEQSISVGEKEPTEIMWGSPFVFEVHQLYCSHRFRIVTKNKASKDKIEILEWCRRCAMIRQRVITINPESLSIKTHYKLKETAENMKHNAETPLSTPHNTSQSHLEINQIEEIE